MQASIFENLEHVRPSHHYSKPVARRIRILENNIRELRKYHEKAGKQKKTVIQALIDKYSACVDRLNSLI